MWAIPPTKKHSWEADITKELFISGYASENGIQRCVFHREEKNITCTAAASEVLNPSYIARSADGANLYAVSETLEGGFVHAYDVSKKGELRHLNALATSGGASCHVSVDPKKEFLVVSNYMSGVVDLFRLSGEDGSIVEKTFSHQHVGTGPNQERQEGPHAHFGLFSPDGTCCYAVDLGNDTVYVYTLDREAGILCQSRAVQLPAGCGPRHLALHPQRNDIFYVTCELSLQIYTVRLEGENVRISAPISCVPGDYSVTAGAAAIKVSPDGCYLYASTRVYAAEKGTDCVACCAITPDGSLRLAGYAEVPGSQPRDLSVSDEHLFFTCQNSNAVVILKRDGATGLPAGLEGTYAFPAPSCIA